MLQSNAIMFGWNRPMVGREGMAGELFAQTVGYFEKLKSTKSIESYEPVFLVDHGGDLGGYFLLKGTHSQLDALKSSDEWVDIVMRAGHSLTGVGIIDCFTGATIPDLMQRWTRSIPTR